MKYIKLKHSGFVIFDERIPHIEMYKATQKNEKAVSAGFIGVEDGKLMCIGKSGTLELNSDPGDTVLLHKVLSEWGLQYMRFRNNSFVVSERFFTFLDLTAAAKATIDKYPKNPTSIGSIGSICLDENGTMVGYKQQAMEETDEDVSTDVKTLQALILSDSLRHTF